MHSHALLSAQSSLKLHVHASSHQVAAKLGITGDAPAFAVGRNYEDFGVEAVPGADHKAFEGEELIILVIETGVAVRCCWLCGPHLRATPMRLVRGAVRGAGHKAFEGALACCAVPACMHSFLWRARMPHTAARLPSLASLPNTKQGPGQGNCQHAYTPC